LIVIPVIIYAYDLTELYLFYNYLVKSLLVYCYIVAVTDLYYILPISVNLNISSYSSSFSFNSFSIYF
jgi:hypothetical protein